MLRLQVRLGVVLPGKVDVITSIRSLEPYTISWSNVPDFMPPTDFHKLAKAVSAPNETVHYMHRHCQHCCRNHCNHTALSPVTNVLPNTHAYVAIHQSSGVCTQLHIQPLVEAHQHSSRRSGMASGCSWVLTRSLLCQKSTCHAAWTMRIIQDLCHLWSDYVLQ
jgi:hypothetical protein